MLNAEQLKKIHIQLGRATESSLIKLLKLSRKIYDSSCLHRIIEECACKLSRPSAGSSIANVHCALYPGHSIAIDVWYPVSQNHPFLIIVDIFSRMTISVPLSSLKPEVLINAMDRNWIFSRGAQSLS